MLRNKILNLREIENPMNLRGIRGMVFDACNYFYPQRRTILFEDGQINEFKDEGGLEGVIDLPDDVLILPGGIDIHVHGRDVFDILPGEQGDQTYKEDSYTLSLALAQGGTTHAVCMPNLGRKIITYDDYQKQLFWINNDLPHRKKPIIQLSMYTLISPGSSPQIDKAIHKLLWNTFGPTNFPNDEEVVSTLWNYGRKNRSEKRRWVTAHCETIADMVKDKNIPHHLQRPKIAAINAVKIFLEAAYKYDFHAHIAHISSAEEVDLVKEYQSKGVSASCEVTPQSLTLDYETFEQVTGLPLIWGQQNPPLRSYFDRLVLLEKQGHIDIYASDHAPHTTRENENGISGMPQASTEGQIYLELLTEGNITLQDYVWKRSITPGSILEKELGLRKGKLEKGYEASFTLVNLGKKSRISNKDVLSKCEWTPYGKIDFSNTIEGVVVGGVLYTQAALQKLRNR